MTFLLTQIFFCLVIAALIGAVAAWFLRRNIALQREQLIQEQWKGRIRQIEIDRDRNVHKLTADIKRIKQIGSESGQSAALADYEAMATQLEEQVSERESVIAELRSELQSVRSEMSEARAVAEQRETDLQQQHKNETANRVAQLADGDNQQAISATDNDLARQHEQQLADLTNRLTGERDAALAELDSLVTEQHEKELAAITLQLAKQQEQALSEQENRLRQQHESEIDELSKRQPTGLSAEQVAELRLQHENEIAKLKLQFEQSESRALSDQVTALREQHDQELADLAAVQERQSQDALHQQEREQQRRHEQEIAVLKSQLATKGSPGSEAASSKIRQLEAEIQLRDDSIAVLRDDLAALNKDRPIDQRGRQDEQLRAAINDSTRWQNKYDEVVSELEAIKEGTGQSRRAMPDPEDLIKSVTRKRQRSSGDRIGSVLSHPGGPRDRLQEIKGIGPVLERKLNDFGIYHFKQIAELDSDDIARLSNELGQLSGRIVRDRWVAQAGKLHHKYHD